MELFHVGSTGWNGNQGLDPVHLAYVEVPKVGTKRSRYRTSHRRAIKSTRL